MSLLRTQRNEVLDVLQEEGWDPRDFAWEGSRLNYVPSDWFFIFGGPGGMQKDFGAQFSPAATRLSEHVFPIPSWSVVLELFREWLRYIQREMDAPDLWAELQRERDLVAGTGAVENTPFSPDEQQQIAAQLREINAYVKKTHELTRGQQDEVTTRLEYLIEAAGRMGRLDWRNALLGAFLGAGVQSMLAPDVVRDILVMVGHALGHMFGGTPPALPGP